MLAKKTAKVLETATAEVKDAVKEAVSTSGSPNKDFRPVNSRTSDTSTRSKLSKASPKLVYRKSDRNEDTDSSGDDADFDDKGFQHPSTYEEQPCIWIPKDGLGLSRYLIAELRASDVLASDEGTSIGDEGYVVVTQGPPDES